MPLVRAEVVEVVVVEVVVVRADVDEVEVVAVPLLVRPEPDEVVEVVDVVAVAVPDVRAEVPALFSTSVRSWAAFRTDTPEALAALVTRRSKELSGCATA